VRNAPLRDGTVRDIEVICPRRQAEFLKFRNGSERALAPLGHEVHAETEVVKVLGKRIEFKVSAHDETEEIGRGTHRRMVIDLASFNERLARKSRE
jgi:Fluoroacetyl-CoA-specific thioesterase